MTPARALEEIVCGYGIDMSVSRHRTVKWYLDRGKEIPDFNLPGRAIMIQRPEIREQLVKLTASDTWHNRDVVDIRVGSHLSETELLFARIANRR